MTRLPRRGGRLAAGRAAVRRSHSSKARWTSRNGGRRSGRCPSPPAAAPGGAGAPGRWVSAAPVAAARRPETASAWPAARRVPGEGVGDRGGELPGVRRGRGPLPQAISGAEEIRGAQHEPGLGHRGVAGLAGDAEVDQVRHTVRVDDHVARLTSRASPAGVRGVERARQVDPHARGGDVVEHAVVAHEIAERLAVDVAHDDHHAVHVGQAGVAAGGHQVVDAHAVGVPHRGQRAGLALEALLGLRVGRVRRLERDDVPELVVLGEPHPAEATRPEPADRPEARAARRADAAATVGR